jgi:hypothetical protein
MDLRISGNFRGIRKDCHKANSDFIRFLFANKILLLRGGICQEAFDIWKTSSSKPSWGGVVHPFRDFQYSSKKKGLVALPGIEPGFED